MELKILENLKSINRRLEKIESSISQLDEKLDFSVSLQRNHLLRVKNGQEIDDEMILLGRPYNDLNPQRAQQIYNNPDIDFIVLDVSHDKYPGHKRLADSINIPLEQLESRYLEIQIKTTPILIISEVGLRSIQASEFLITRGYFNVNNISGGHKFWRQSNFLGEFNNTQDK